MTVLIRCRTRRAVDGWAYPGGRSLSITSAAVKFADRQPADPEKGETGQARQPVAGVALVAPSGAHLVPDRSAASAKVGMLLRRRFSASGSPPARASLRFANAWARASF